MDMKLESITVCVCGIESRGFCTNQRITHIDPLRLISFYLFMMGVYECTLKSITVNLKRLNFHISDYMIQTDR